MKMYTVTADVKSEKYGNGQLEAQLNEQEFIEYANLSDKDKLQFLKDKGAQFKVDVVNDLSDADVTNYNINHADQEVLRGEPRVTRKMRMNINGKDTGWVDVTEENEKEYNQMMEQFNQMNQQFNERFRNFFNMTPSRFLDFGSPLGLKDSEEEKEE